MSENDFFRHRKIKKIDKDDLKLIKDLIEAEAQPKNISYVLNSSKGNGETYDPQFIRNKRQKIKETEHSATIEELFSDLFDDEGFLA